MGAETIARLLQPRAVAVFGASDDPAKYGGRIMHYLGLHGYAGDIVPINSRRDVVAGRKCYAAIGDAPSVDVAVIALPAPALPQTLRECAAAGVAACVVITAGFAEAGAEGAALQDEMLTIAREAGMRLVGPNCMGLMNLRNGMALTAARVFDAKPVVAPIGLISQSGAVMLSVFNRAQDQGIGFSQIISVGNQADLEVCDFFEYMIGDTGTEVICLHIEGLQDGPRFRELMFRAHAASKPVVVLKTGRSAQGGEVAKSHTASLAGAYPVFAAACREAGAVLVDDPDVMILAAAMLQRFGPAPAVRKIAMLSPSGGFNGIVVDRMSDLGLELARFTPSTRTALARVLPADHVDNPLDLGLIQNVTALEGTAEMARRAAADASVGLTFVPLTTSPDYERTVTALADALAASGKPALFAVTPGSVADGVRKIIRDKGLPYCDRIDDAVRLLRAYFSDRPQGAAASPQARRNPPCEAPSGYLAEPATKALLALAGVRVTRETVVASAAQAAAAGQAIGFPVVLKGVSDSIVHKSDAGLVRLQLRDQRMVQDAFNDVRRIMDKLDPAATSCVVAEMAQGELELIVGVKHDPLFGPAVLVGAGGVMVDLFNDVEVALAPLSPQTARDMLGRLKVAPLLTGYRGKPPLDVEAVVDTLVKVGEFADQYRGCLLELDINPLLVRRAGEGVVALDARSNFT
jgi:acetyl-CoA synthetase (ADP-forming)